MFLEILLAILLGVLAGCFTGLIPGVHVNLIATLVSSSAAFLLEFISFFQVVGFIISLSITHSFLSTIPSIFLGAPESGTSLGVLPGHAMLIEGKGFEAVMLTILGSFFGLLFCFLLYPLLSFVLENSYDFVSNFMGELLLAIGFFLIVRSKMPILGLALYLFSGSLGYLALNSEMSEPLFALLSGLFGVSTLAVSLFENSKMPSQSLEDADFNLANFSPFLALSSVAGFITSVLPGLGSSAAAAIVSMISPDSEKRSFLFMIGGITTSNFFCSIVALQIIGKARNGSIVALQSIGDAPVALMLSSALISAGISFALAPYLIKFFCFITTKVNYVYLAGSTIILLIALSFAFDGYIGFYTLFIAFLIGYVCISFDMPRNILMSCIMLPVALFFIL